MITYTYVFYRSGSASCIILVRPDRETSTGYEHCYQRAKVFFHAVQAVDFLLSICSECIQCWSSCRGLIAGYVGGPFPCIGYPSAIILIHGVYTLTRIQENNSSKYKVHTYLAKVPQWLSPRRN